MIRVCELFRVFLGFVMIVAFFGKGIDLEEFEVELKTLVLPFLTVFTRKIHESQALVKWIEPFLLPMALLTLLIESFIGFFLLFRVYVRVSAFMLILLLMLFTSILVINLLYSNSELKTCGCFGVLWEEPITWWSVGRNVVLIGMAWIVYHSEASRK